MQRQNIIFNLDDTLSECNKYFNQVIEQFAQQMLEWFPNESIDEIKKEQINYDLKYVDKGGLTVDHLPQSFSSTYQHFCEKTGIAIDEMKKEQLTKLGLSVFDIPVEPLPYMYETLEQLKYGGHQLFLHTGGEEKNQRRKITQLQLAAFFDNRIFISLHKDVKALEKILSKMNFDKSVTWMVGNSLRTDIIPGLEQGINVIYIPAPNEWHYNVVEVNVEPKGAFITLQSLNEVPEAINKYVNEQHQKNHMDINALNVQESQFTNELQ